MNKMIKKTLILIITSIFISGCNISDVTEKLKEQSKFKNNDVAYTSPDGRIQIKIRYDNQTEKEYLNNVYGKKVNDLIYYINETHRLRVEQGVDLDSIDTTDDEL